MQFLHILTPEILPEGQVLPMLEWSSLSPHQGEGVPPRHIVFCAVGLCHQNLLSACPVAMVSEVRMWPGHALPPQLRLEDPWPATLHQAEGSEQSPGHPTSLKTRSVPPPLSVCGDRTECPCGSALSPPNLAREHDPTGASVIGPTPVATTP